VRCAAIEIKRKKTAVQSLKTLAADNVKQLYISDWKGLIATGLYTLVRHLDFNISSIKQIELGLPFQIETLTHMSVEELTYATQIRPQEAGAESTIFLASKEALKRLLQEWSELSVAPDFVTSSAEALVQFALFRSPTLSSAFLIDLGSQEWTCVWMEKGAVKKAFILQEGIESLLSALWEDRKEVLLPKETAGIAHSIDLLQIPFHLNSKLSTQLTELRNKLSNVLCSFQQAGGVKPVFFTGRTDAFGNLTKYLLEKAPDLTLFEPPVPLNFEESKCAMALGFALAGSAKESVKVQFLKGEFTTKKSWRRAGHWGIGLTFASLFLSAALISWGSKHFLNIRQEMAGSLKRTLEKMDKKLGNSLLTDVDEGMTQAFRAIQKYNIESPYLLTSPTVSEVVSWLSSHPLLQTLREGGDALEILDLKYHLVSYSRIDAPRDPYQAKIELEFRVKSPMSARKFHEALLQGDSFIDSTQEISWESLQNSYKTSLYLKNRPPYVR
jgi:hypothetical protein